ncbi:hypothetical protein C4K05_0814 [Pseudomonas chlororaphis subsp. aureofaciens]|nr:hypothetical protein C4K10_0785 [Pseudomonas chlororaphis subsp. aureofaciens]AZE33842.1 hypothetical protein C4K06_0787 [Pseudomonas chlororaphis subsp. aureofaciens]AZE40176.1 hypothetical protein C4K05_0814 [Pseudomonas chlororaphis subsp. aureofaciens]
MGHRGESGTTLSRASLAPTMGQPYHPRDEQASVGAKLARDWGHAVGQIRRHRGQASLLQNRTQPSPVPPEALSLPLQRMKIPLVDFHYSRHDLSVRDKACLYTKVTFMRFENLVTK